MSLKEYIELSLVKESTVIKSLESLNNKLRPEGLITILNYLPSECQDVIEQISNLAKPIIDGYFSNIKKVITGESTINEVNNKLLQNYDKQLIKVKSLKTSNKQEKYFQKEISNYLLSVKNELIKNGLKHYKNILSDLKTVNTRIDELISEYPLISESLIGLSADESLDKLINIIYGSAKNESIITRWITKHKRIVFAGLTGLMILSQATRIATALENNSIKAFFVEGVDTDDTPGDDTWKVWQGNYDPDDQSCSKEYLIYTVHGKKWDGNAFLGYSCDMGTPNNNDDDCWIDFTPREGGYDAKAYNIGGSGEYYNFKIEGGINQETVITSMHPQSKAMSPLPFNTPIGDRIGETNCDLAFKSYDENGNDTGGFNLLKELPVFLLGVGSGSIIGSLITRKVIKKNKKTKNDEPEMETFMNEKPINKKKKKEEKEDVIFEF